jgi:hypothetical protein
MMTDGLTAVSKEASEETVERRRMHLLRQVAELGGAISPIADPAAKHGYRFDSGNADVERDLADLAKLNYLNAIFRPRSRLPAMRQPPPQRPRDLPNLPQRVFDQRRALPSFSMWVCRHTA